MTNPNASLFVARTTRSPLGTVEVQAGREGLLAVNLPGRSAPGSGAEIEPSTDDPAGIALCQILEYLDGKRKAFDLTIDWSYIKPFQVHVLERAMRIPFGEVMTYGQIAVELSGPAASRAVGGALAHNPIPIVIPCHRVVASDGRLTGFSAADGIRAKQWLLELEGHRVVGEKLA
jgi:methylated-DNA-[protein]-cysteine S-methyltransferase